MCGIAGICNPDGLSPAQQQAILPMTALLTHRGPDGTGHYADRYCTLGHTRLSIVDPLNGQQPMHNEDRSIWLVCNGEIYNFPELRKRLKTAGHTFNTHCDSEVILHLYEDQGPNCLQQLRGMFALAIWDSRRRSLLLARDRLGIKPLYWSQSRSGLVFGSELKALLPALSAQLQLDPYALADYLVYNYIPGPRTVFQNTHKLEPGHMLLYTSGRLRQCAYWDLQFCPSISNHNSDAAELLRRKLRESVRLHLMADVPVGAFLSGGLDSSSVVAMMAEASHQPVITSSVGFAESDYDELSYAQIVAEAFRTDHHASRLWPDISTTIEALAWHYDEPFADSSAVPTYWLARSTADRVKVALSGDGADELLAGYRRYLFAVRENLLRQPLPPALRRAVFAPLARVYPQSPRLPRYLRGRSTIANLATDLKRAHYLSVAPTEPQRALSLLSADLQRQLQGYDPYTVLHRHFAAAPTDQPLNQCLYVDLKTYLPDDILCKVDRASMAVGLEVRVPFLDHHLVQFATTLPADLKLRGRRGKYLLRRAMRPHLPPKILQRPKQGFAVPLRRWLLGPLRQMLHQTIASPNAHISGWLDQSALTRIWQDYQRNRRDDGPLLWAVLMLELWARNFLNRSPLRRSARAESLLQPVA